MCYQVECRSCGRTTWAGCGQHVEATMSSVRVADRCTCTPEQRAASSRSMLDRLLRR